MFCKQKRNFSRLLIMAVLFLSAGILALAGCATAPTPKTLNPDVKTPQVVVNPESITLGAANLLGAKIVFEGSGFKPNDSVFITLYGPNDTQAVVADGKVGADGKFTATVGTLAKVTAILKGTISGKYKADGSYDQFVVLTQPPIPAGMYTAKATSMLSDKTAETKLEIREASLGDSLKDSLAGMLGKIQDKRP